MAIGALVGAVGAGLKPAPTTAGATLPTTAMRAYHSAGVGIGGFRANEGKHGDQGDARGDRVPLIPVLALKYE